MTDIDTAEGRAELRRLAEEARPGPWRLDWSGQQLGLYAASQTTDDDPITEWTYVISRQEHRDECDTADADFIAAANPATMIALLDEVEELRTALAEVDPITVSQSTLLKARAESAETRCEQLSAEISYLREEYLFWKDQHDLVHMELDLRNSTIRQLNDSMEDRLTVLKDRTRQRDEARAALTAVLEYVDRLAQTADMSSPLNPYEMDAKPVRQKIAKDIRLKVVKGLDSRD